MRASNLAKITSEKAINKVRKSVPTNTIIVAFISSDFEDQDTFFNSSLTSLKKLGILLKKLITFISFCSSGEAGVEPATPGFGDRCSSQLSYSPTIQKINITI